MTTFTQQEIEFLQKHSNEVCKHIWLGLYDDRSSAVPDFREPQKVKEFLQEKYEKKRWYVPPEQAKMLASVQVPRSGSPASSSSTPEVPPLKTLQLNKTPSSQLQEKKFDLLSDLGGDIFAAPPSHSAAPTKFTNFAHFSKLSVVGHKILTLEMEELIKTTVYKEEHFKGNKKEADITVHVLEKDLDACEFIQQRLTAINTSKDANFRTVNSASLQNQKHGYFLFLCKRSEACTQRSRRAKGCKAYVSFKKRTDWLNKLVIVESLYSIHSGHDPSSSSEGCSENISQELIKNIQDLKSLGVKPDTILLKSYEWSREQGHPDLNN
ncbi:arfGAP with FG repeats 1b isoform X1 [Silurus meridionalis]|nr:arfGAP with FG repeats 1b isoform X1 [Silurus meridionalis]